MSSPDYNYSIFKYLGSYLATIIFKKIVFQKQTSLEISQKFVKLQKISEIFPVKLTLIKYNLVGNCHFQIIFFSNSAAFSCFGNSTSFSVYLHAEGFAFLG